MAMLGAADLLRLHEVRNEAERFLKPWWDRVIDYIILALVMVAVICAVVSPNEPGLVCVPVVNCQVLGNSSRGRTEICAKVANTCENRKDPDKLYKAVVKFSNQNLYDYINVECAENINWWVRLFPNVLIVMAGVCLVCNNAWFVLQSPTLELFIDLLQECYRAPNAPPQQADPDNALPAEPDAREKMNRFLEHFDRGGAIYFRFCSLWVLYFIVLGLQILFALLIIVILCWIANNHMKRQYDCNIDDIIFDIVFDKLLCSYSIFTYYQKCYECFLVFASVQLVFSISKALHLAIIQCLPENPVEGHRDLKFLVTLLELSNLPYLEPFRRIYNELQEDNDLNED